jgi:hypothetical protein
LIQPAEPHRGAMARAESRCDLATDATSCTSAQRYKANL